jgi:hypothetical protein
VTAANAKEIEQLYRQLMSKGAPPVPAESSGNQPSEDSLPAVDR